MVKGVVGFVNAKDWEDRRSGETIQLYSFKIEGDDTWYRTGQKKPPFVKGQSISFDVDKKGNADLDSLQILESEVKQAPKVASGGDKVMSRDDYFRRKEERFQEVDVPRMTFCTSQDAAIKVVDFALRHECLPKMDAKSGRLKAVLTYIDELTDRFYKQRMAASVDTEEPADPAVEEKGKGKSLDD